MIVVTGELNSTKIGLDEEIVSMVFDTEVDEIINSWVVKEATKEGIIDVGPGLGKPPTLASESSGVSNADKVIEVKVLIETGAVSESMLMAVVTDVTTELATNAEEELTTEVATDSATEIVTEVNPGAAEINVL